METRCGEQRRRAAPGDRDAEPADDDEMVQSAGSKGSVEQEALAEREEK